MWSYPTITKTMTYGILISLIATCRSSSDPTAEAILHGSIAYPFYEPNPIGRNGSEEKFVIRSAVGNTEYTIEIPGAAKEYDIEVPLAALDSAATGGPDRPKGLAKPNATDRELVASFPAIEKSDPAGTGFMDNAFGVSQAGGPKQAPSYTINLAKVTKLYKQKEYEYALVEVNNMIAFYPNSPQLHKMKGTILVKLRNLPLAEKSWIRAIELAPKDQILKNALAKLQKRIKTQFGQNDLNTTSETKEEVPSIVSPQQTPEGLLSH